VKAIESNEKKKLLNGQYTLGPSLFMKLETLPNLFSKEKEATVICLDDDEEAEKKNLHKKLEASGRAFEIKGKENKTGGFAMFSIATKKENSKEVKKLNEKSINENFIGKEEWIIFG